MTDTLGYCSKGTPRGVLNTILYIYISIQYCVLSGVNTTDSTIVYRVVSIPLDIQYCIDIRVSRLSPHVVRRIV